MHRLLACLPAILLVSSPALAQTYTTSTAPRCTPIAQSIGLFQARQDMGIEDLDDGCRITNAYLVFDPIYRMSFDELVITGADLEDAITLNRQFRQADITLTGLRYAPDMSSPLFNYITEIQTRPFNLHLAYRWDEETGDTEISQLRLWGHPLGDWQLSARLGNIANLELLTTGAVPFEGTLEELIVTARERYVIANFLAPAMISTFPYDEDPVPHIAAAQAAFAAAIDALPEHNASPDTRAALKTAINQFPTVRGDYTMALRPLDAPVPLMDAMIETPEDLTKFLSQLTIVATVEEEE